MKRKKLGQVSIEVLLIVGLILVITIPFMAGALNNLADRTGIESRIEEAMQIAHAFETVANLGPGNGIVVETPSGGIAVENNNLVSEGFSIPLVPTVDDVELEGNNKVAIANTGKVEVFPAPVILDYPFVTKIRYPETFISFKVENFDGTGKVFFDESEIENFAFYENNVEFNVPMEIIEEKGPGVYEVYLKMMYGGVDLVSESKGFEFTEREEATP